VKVVWTREEEFTWAYFRPAGVIDISSGVRNDGTLTAWEFHNYNSGGSGIRTPYEVANQRIEFHPVESPLRQGSYRALAATANHFARETNMDELARLVKMDPLEFRLNNLTDARLRRVLETAAGKFGWKAGHAPSGRGFGMACGVYSNACNATIAEVAVNRGTGAVQVKRVVMALDVGMVVNPDGMRQQAEGCVVMGLGYSLSEELRFRGGDIGASGRQ